MYNADADISLLEIYSNGPMVKVCQVTMAKPNQAFTALASGTH
jgi:hypothetical protein